MIHQLAAIINQGNLAPTKNFSSGYQPTGNLGSDVTRLISNLLGLFTIIAGLTFIFFFMVGALNWITAGGDPNKSQASRQMVVNAVLGLVITVIAYPVLLLISYLLGVPLADPASLINQLF